LGLLICTPPTTTELVASVVQKMFLLLSQGTMVIYVENGRQLSSKEKIIKLKPKP
jgi:hypothetical protein